MANGINIPRKIDRSTGRLIIAFLTIFTSCINITATITMKKQVVIPIKSPLTFVPFTRAENTEGDSLTIQNESKTIRELFERHAEGMLPNYTDAQYDENPDIEDADFTRDPHIDLTDIEEAKNIIIETEKKKKEAIEKAEVKKAEKAEAKNAEKSAEQKAVQTEKNEIEEKSKN